MPLAYATEKAHRGQGRQPVPLHRDKVEECPWRRQLSLIVSFDIIIYLRNRVEGFFTRSSQSIYYPVVIYHNHVPLCCRSKLAIRRVSISSLNERGKGTGLSDESPRTTPRFEALNMREKTRWTCRDRGCVAGRVECSNSARYCFLDSSANWIMTRVVSKNLPRKKWDQTSASNLGLVFINLHRPVSGTFSRLGYVRYISILI